MFPNPRQFEPISPAMAQNDLIQLARDSGYPVGAFLFVQRGLEFTVHRRHGAVGPDPASIGGEPGSDADAGLGVDVARHVSGRELCQGLRDFAVKEYGLMARTVLRRWRIRSSRDFGKIVFAMVDAGLMHKTDEDSLEDFDNVFHIDTAFAGPGGLGETRVS